MTKLPENAPGNQADAFSTGNAVEDELTRAMYPGCLENIRRLSPNVGAGVLGVLETCARGQARSIARASLEQQKNTPMLVPVTAEPPPTAKVLQFPLPFGEQTRAVSNPMARCALFAAVKERQFFKDYVTVGVINGVTIEYKGEQLNQVDHDTILQLVKMALHKEFGMDVCVSVNSVLAHLGRHTNQEQRGQLFEQISRLVSGTLRITSPGRLRYEGHLIDDASTPVDQQILPRLRRNLTYRLNPRLAFFYNESAYTIFDWQQRLKIKGRGAELAKWLQLWIESNAEQYPTKVETIREKCGSNDKTLYSFRQKLRQALDGLKAAEIIHSWRIDEADLVHIDRTPSESQQKHLNKSQCRRAKPKAPPKLTAPTDDLPRNLKPTTIERFRALYPRLDPYACKADFDEWGKTSTPRNYDAAFLGFAEKWAIGNL